MLGACDYSHGGLRRAATLASRRTFWKYLMSSRIIVALFTLSFSVPAFADCADDACRSIQKILQARSSSFSAFKGKPGRDPRGDPLWEGKQTISGLIDDCYVYPRGENSHYEYYCDASALSAKTSVSLEKARQIAETVKTSFQAADPKLIWFTDPDALALASVDGFEGSEGWYGGYSKNKLAVKVAVFGPAPGNTTVVVKVFAKFLKRRNVR
jgi:hypothetical protein